MATFDNDLRLKEIISGDEDGTWGDSTNLNLELIANAFSYGTADIPTDGDVTFTIADGVADDARSLVLEVTSTASLTATRTVTLAPSSVSKTWFIKNSTTGGQSITIAQGSGSTVTVANGKTVGIYTDGAGLTAAVTQLQTKDDFNLGTTDSPTFADLTLTGNLGAVDGTFTGNVAVTGTVDGRDVATDGTKLDGIEPNATADQTPAEIKTAYESNADTNAFTDSEKTKLGTVESGADVTDATNVDAAGAVMNTDTSTAAMGFVIDEDDMASNSDTKVPTQQSTRAYVDDTVTSIGALATSGSPVATDYARFTHPSRIEGRSPAEVLTDINAQEDLSGLVLTPAVVASTDKVLIQDTDDSDNLKTINVADILASVGNTYAKTEFTATGGQTDFTVSYIVGLVDVYLNGICLDSTEFTATNGTSITLAAGATAGDKLKVISWETFEVLNGLTTSDIGVTVQEEISGATLTGVTAQGTDKVLIQDVSDSDNLKTVTVSDIAANAPATSYGTMYKFQF